MSKGERIHIDLTEQQQTQIKRLSGKDIPALEFDAQELEQRVAPMTVTKQLDSASPNLS
jgi:hypothetical protein